MSRKPQSKDQLEALDFIINVLKEHEKDLDRLIGELGSVTENFGQTGELTCKMEHIEQRISSLQNQISNFVVCLSQPSMNNLPKEKAALMAREQKTQNSPVPTSAPAPLHSFQRASPMILRCKQWNDFQTLAFGAQTLSFKYRAVEGSFQANALKGNQVITYSGELPKFALLMKIWLSKQLNVSEDRILEDVLAIG
jgi:hypothetical protein